jgi:membrane-bound serine protease (ClpP class)
LPELQIGLRLIIPVTLGIAGILLFLVTLAVNAQRTRPMTGASAMLHELGYALTAIDAGGTGSVRTHGEIWTASADERIEPGTPVRVTAVDGLRLRVTAAAEASEHHPA